MADPAARDARAQVVDTATEWAFAAGWALVRRLPERAAYGAFAQAADAMWRRRGPGVEQLERNLARITPGATAAELRELSRASMHSYLRYWCDAFRLPTWSAERVEAFCKVDGVERLDDLALTGQGAVLAAGHSGNWDHLGAWACNRYGGLTTVAERLRPERLFDRFVAYRQSLGMDIVPLGDPDSMRRLVAALRDGRLVPLLADRDISRNGVVVDLLGEPASLPAGPAVLASLTGAPVLPVTLWFDGRVSRAHIHAPVEIADGLSRADRLRATTQAVADALGAGMRAHPADWHMMQPVWLADLDEDRRRAGADAVAAAGGEAR